MANPRRNPWWLQLAGVLSVFGIFLSLWQAVVIGFQIQPIILPSPIRVLEAMQKEGWKLLTGFLVTAGAAFSALAISIVLGFLVAIVFSFSRWLRITLYPYVVFLQTVPIVAIAPLLITWFGYGLQTIILVATMISLFPIISNVTAGLISVDDGLIDLFRLNSASRWQMLTKLQIPYAIRSLILGARISAGLAVIGAIVGEFFVGETSTSAAGLGTLIAGWQRMSRTDAMIAAIIFSTLLGLLVLASVNLLSRLLLKKWTDGAFENQKWSR